MSLNWTIDSPSLYIGSTSAVLSTPIRRSSQDTFANTPVDSVVPRTPSITNHQYRIDQCVPHTPATLAIAISPSNCISFPGTPLNNLNAASPSRYSILYFDNQDNNSANAASRDQTVPSTPTSNACEPCRQVNCGDHSSHTSSVLHRNSDSGVSSPFPSSNTVAQSNVTRHLRSSTRNQLSLSTSNTTFSCTVTTHQTVPSNKTSETSGNCSNGNTTVVVNIPEYSSRPSKETCNATTGRLTIPVDHNVVSQSINEPTAPASVSACSSCMLLSDSLATIRASTSCVSPEVPMIHTREIRHVQRQLAHTRDARHDHGGNEAAPNNNSTQLQLFDDDDDIFESFL